MKSKKPIGEITIDAIIRGATNEEVIEEVLKVHPEAKTSDSTVAWYRTRLKSAGARIPSAREAPGIDKGYKPPKLQSSSERSTRQKAREIVCDVMLAKGTNTQAFNAASEKFPDSGIRKREVSDLRHILVHLPNKNVLSDLEARKVQGKEASDKSRDPREDLTEDERSRCKALLDELREILSL